MWSRVLRRGAVPLRRLAAPTARTLARGGGASLFVAGTATASLALRSEHGAMHCKGEDAAALAARLGKGLPLARDLTSNAEAMQCLALATEILNSGVDIEELKKIVYANPTTTPAILISAVGSAESKLKIQKCGKFHMTCIFAMFMEQNRIRTKQEHENGQDLVRMKVAQLEWLFAGEPEGKTWELLAVDDGCPNDSMGLARKIVAQEKFDKVKIISLQEAIDQQIPYFVKDRNLKNCKESRKGGAILYGLWYAAKNAPAKKGGWFGGGGGVPQYVMYTDSDLSTDMSLCGLLSAGMQTDGCSISMGARYGTPETFLVKEKCLGHPESHYDQPNMMKIVFRHYARIRMLPMLEGIYDTQCAFKCFNVYDIPAIIEPVKRLGPDFDMELLLCALQFYQKKGVAQKKLCKVYGTLFTEDFAESNFSATAGDPDKPYKTYTDMTKGLIAMHQRYIAAGSKEAKQAEELVAFCKTLDVKRYKNMIVNLEKELGPTLFDYDFGLDKLKKAAAA